MWNLCRLNAGYKIRWNIENLKKTTTQKRLKMKAIQSTVRNSSPEILEECPPTKTGFVHVTITHSPYMNGSWWTIWYGQYHMAHIIWPIWISHFPLGNPPEAKRNKICLLFYSTFSRPTLSSCWFLLFHYHGKRTTGHQNSALNDSTAPTQERCCLPAIGLV